MFRLPILLMALTALSACRFDSFYAEDVTIATRDRDLAQCEAAALQSHPEDLSVRFRPRQFHPGRQICNVAGHCRIITPYWTGGERFTVDRNTNARADALRACMGARGYTQISLPACPSGTPVATTMPGLTSDSCVINRRSGDGLVVSP